VYNYNEYNKYKTIALIQLFAIFICSAAGIYLLKYSKKNSIDEHMIIIGAKALYNKIPFDIRTLVLVFALLIAPEIYGDKSIFPRLDSEFLLVLALVTAFTFYFYISIPEAIRSLKDKEEFKNQFESGVVYRFKEAAIRGLREKNILFKCIIYVTAFGLLSTITAVILEHDGLAAVVFILIYVFLSFLFISRKISMLDKIIKGTNEITKGNLNYVIKEKGKGNLSRLAHNINNMKSGISKAVESQMKSDRLKSELITNVSHDLKTPLTSIINYVDLLKKEDLSKDELQGYISVLDRKTQRLKVLIEDLFEASKMASGAVELNIEKVDVAQLLNQSLAELDEKIRHSNLAFRVNIPHHKVYAELDGKKTWRVFENLIGNILKYSQPNTRVYIDLTETDDKVLIIMKNISSYEMEFDVEEIFERFKRGDTSRATEGSGLGLAIAKSIVDIQGGSLTIDIDGDLFKSTVEFNK
jgi:signal transduction histidine kinase